MSPQLLATGGTFFFFVAWLLRHSVAAIYLTPAQQLLALQSLVVLGAVVFVTNRASKFSLFKPAEEMVYIMLDKESRTKGKAAIDVVGSQMGKASSSMLQQFLLVLSGGSMLTMLPVMTIFQGLILRLWLNAVTQLGKFYDSVMRVHDGMASPSSEVPGAPISSSSSTSTSSSSTTEPPTAGDQTIIYRF